MSMLLYTNMQASRMECMSPCTPTYSPPPYEYTYTGRVYKYMEYTNSIASMDANSYHAIYMLMAM